MQRIDRKQAILAIEIYQCVSELIEATRIHGPVRTGKVPTVLVDDHEQPLGQWLEGVRQHLFMWDDRWRFGYPWDHHKFKESSQHRGRLSACRGPFSTRPLLGIATTGMARGETTTVTTTISNTEGQQYHRGIILMPAASRHESATTLQHSKKHLVHDTQTGVRV